MQVETNGFNATNKPVAIKVTATGEAKADPALLTALALIAEKINAMLPTTTTTTTSTTTTAAPTTTTSTTTTPG